MLKWNLQRFCVYICYLIQQPMLRYRDKRRPKMTLARLITMMMGMKNPKTELNFAFWFAWNRKFFSPPTAKPLVLPRVTNVTFNAFLWEKRVFKRTWHYSKKNKRISEIFFLPLLWIFIYKCVKFWVSHTLVTDSKSTISLCYWCKKIFLHLDNSCI